MNLPNKLTLLRVILVPVFMVFAAFGRIGTSDYNPTAQLVAGIIFAVASFTDFLDGYLARKNNLVTDFGKFMDPLVRYRHCRQHVGQGQDGFADAHHHLLLHCALLHGPH